MHEVKLPFQKEVMPSTLYMWRQAERREGLELEDGDLVAKALVW
jgi:hypothetical protein